MLRNKRKTEQVQSRASQQRPAHPLPETGGRGEEKGANSAPETAPPTKLQTGFQFLIKAFLRFWMVDIRREGQARDQLPRRDTRRT